MGRDVFADNLHRYLAPKTERIQVLCIDDGPANLVSLEVDFRHRFEIVTTEGPRWVFAVVDMLLQAATCFSKIEILSDTGRQMLQKRIQALQ